MIADMTAESHFKRIALVANMQLPEIVDTLKRLSEFLEKSGYTVLFESQTAQLLDDQKLATFNCQDSGLEHRCL